LHVFSHTMTFRILGKVDPRESREKIDRRPFIAT
jgi:hypothetical protein